MDIRNLGDIGYAAALAFSAVGSVFGTGISGLAAIGAWKRCILQEKPIPFILTAFVGAPLTQTIYGYILMNTIFELTQRTRQSGVGVENGIIMLAAGVLGGIAIGLSSYMQGKAGAAASDALAETGQGFGNFMMILGIIESVGLFVMIFLMVTLNKLM